MKSIQDIEPTILEAQRGVKNIKKQQLTEIRSMVNPLWCENCYGGCLRHLGLPIFQLERYPTIY